MKALPDGAERAPVRFPDWKGALARAGLPQAQAESHRRAILGFLHHCKVARAPVSVALIRRYLAEVAPEAQAALRWFYRSAQGGATMRPVPAVETAAEAVARAGGERRDGGVTSPVRGVPSGSGGGPPRPQDDMGGADWERDLIAAVRARGFLWRTEETYRGWSARFADYLAPRSPYAATAEDVGGFLSELAVRQRAMPSTQKQAA